MAVQVAELPKATSVSESGVSDSRSEPKLEYLAVLQALVAHKWPSRIVMDLGSQVTWPARP